jgi:divalent metal cation (Fe/Co/Zn/Cd) transporter
MPRRGEFHSGVMSTVEKILILIVGGIVGLLVGVTIEQSIQLSQLSMHWQFGFTFGRIVGAAFLGLVVGVLSASMFRERLSALISAFWPPLLLLAYWFGLHRGDQKSHTIVVPGHSITHIIVPKMHPDYKGLVIMLVVSGVAGLLAWILVNVAHRRKSIS